MREIQMIGQKYGRWTVLKKLPRNPLHPGLYYLCRCDCGTEKEVIGQSLRIGTSTSCGCYLKEKYSDPVNNKKLYGVYHSMRERCRNKNHKYYHNYGGRGISVCEEWDQYRVFEKWSLEHGYKDGLTLDRIDNNGNYSPDNCRWTTYKVQENNKRNTAYITINGVSKTYSEWSELSGLNRETIRKRVRLGWSEDRLLIPKQVGYPRRKKKEEEI